MEKLDFVKGNEKLPFWGVGDSDVVYHRMKGFEEFSTSLNPNEYSRKYIDEDYERTDVTHYSPSVSFGFDLIKDNEVHSDIAKMADNEVVGSAAVRSVLIVDLSSESKAGAYKAYKRDYEVIMDSEDGSEMMYKYSGNLKVAGSKVFGTATTTDVWKTAKFTEDSE